MNDPTVLVVDDEPNVVRLCRRLLERAEFHVLTSTSATQALSILTRQPVDVMLVDIRMPGLDGFQLLSLAQRHQPEAVSVIMTGFGTLDTATQALHHGASGLILKPFDGDELVADVKHALDESQSRREMQRLKVLRPMMQITEKLFAQTDLDQLYQVIVTTVQEQLESDAAGIFCCSKSGEPVETVFWVGDVPPNDICKFKGFGRGVELFHRERLADPEMKDFLAQSNVISLLSGPLNRSGIPGVMTNEDKSDGPAKQLLSIGERGAMYKAGSSSSSASNATMRQPDALLEVDPSDLVLCTVRLDDRSIFQDSDRELFTLILRQASLALENARLYSDLRIALQQEQRAQQAVLQAEKFAAAGRLTASIAHEINNPLQAVRTQLELGLRMDPSPPKLKKRLQVAQTELERLMKTVQRILDFYRPEVRDRRLTDVNRLIVRVLELLGPQLEDYAIDYHIELYNSLPMVVVVPDQIQQVIFNLVINAMEAMPEGGELWVSTGLAPLRNVHSASRSTSKEDDDGSETLGPAFQTNGIEIIIEDSGPGIAPSQQKQLFEPLVSTKEYGTGLGLSISYGIILAHGGELEYLDDRGRGACFRIILPEE